MDELPKNAKTLEEIESELMFGEIPDDGSENGNIFDDEYDVANDETFGDVLLGATDAELEDYAAQTARLRLDDPVWENPTSSAAAPDASQIPMPFSLFGSGGATEPLFPSSFQNDSSFLEKSIWGDESSSKPFSSIWANDFGITGIDKGNDSQLGDISSLLGDDNTQFERKSPLVPGVIPAMPQSALTLEDLEKWDESSPSVLGLAMQSMTISEPPPHTSALPAFPTAALSLDELERQLMQPTVAANIPVPPVQNQEAQQLQSPSQNRQRQNLPQFSPMSMPPPGFPKLPPLNPQFLPFVHIWLTHIMSRYPLPPGVPPVPPFLFQLLQRFQNPQLVHQMIMASSIPPHMMMGPPQMSQPPPQSPMNKSHKKQPGMPSIRTIQDLALDSFAGYMSWKEREWLVKIQLLQCKGCGDPMVEDYYYTTWREKQIENGWVPKPKNEAEEKSKNESKQDYIERTRRMNYREMQKERASEREKERQKERAERGEEKRQKLTLSDKFASSLGLPSKSSTANPRQLISMKRHGDSEISKLTDEERKNCESILMLLEVDDLRTNNIGSTSRFYELSSKEREAAADERVAVIIQELMGDDMQKLLQMGKGRVVINKTLKYASPKEQARIILNVMSAGGLVNKKLFGEIVLDILPTIHSKLALLHKDQLSFLIQALNLDTLKKQLLENNSLIRDILLTITMISVDNNQPFLDWMAGTKFPSLALSENKSLTTWRKALKVLNSEKLNSFAEVIEESKIKDCDELASLIRESI
ncbi:unnamed protein product [Caenorhabditis angaria]|uniref:mRNA decay factor PAT1 domain-containing protein n=1 Tax=Caenorhabditis angaria TaxID=860376 RepID=A0A9P1IBN1_9PELO|nr:unnamed protein product [Caenorhabditis angaria]